jgi:hypothetical protein
MPGTTVERHEKGAENGNVHQRLLWPKFDILLIQESSITNESSIID